MGIFHLSVLSRLDISRRKAGWLQSRPTPSPDNITVVHPLTKDRVYEEIKSCTEDARMAVPIIAGILFVTALIVILCKQGFTASAYLTIAAVAAFTLVPTILFLAIIYSRLRAIRTGRYTVVKAPLVAVLERTYADDNAKDYWLDFGTYGTIKEGGYCRSCYKHEEFYLIILNRTHLIADVYRASNYELSTEDFTLGEHGYIPH